MRLAQTNFNALGYCKNDEAASFAYLRRCGFEYVDVSLIHHFWAKGDGRGPQYKSIADNIRAGMDVAGVTPVQCHAHGYTHLEPSQEFDMDATRAIETAAKIGSPSVTFHPGTAAQPLSPEQFWEMNAAVFKKLLPTAEKYGIRLLVENIGSARENFYCCNARDMGELIRMIDHPLMGVCWDVGHANIVGSDPYKDITGLGSKLCAIHVHDNRGFSEFGITNTYKSDFHLPPLFGYIDFDAVIKGLIDVGYKGCFTMESCAPELKQRREDSRLNDVDVDIYEYIDKYLHRIGEFMLKRYDCFEK